MRGGGVLYYAPVLACVTTTPENVNIVGIYQYISRPNVHYISVEISRHYLVLCAGRCQSTNNIENISRCNNAHVRPTYYTTQLAYIAEHLLYAVGINPLDRTHSWRIPQFTWLGPLRRKIQTCPVRLISHKTVYREGLAPLTVYRGIHHRKKLLGSSRHDNIYGTPTVVYSGWV